MTRARTRTDVVSPINALTCTRFIVRRSRGNPDFSMRYICRESCPVALLAIYASLVIKSRLHIEHLFDRDQQSSGLSAGVFDVTVQDVYASRFRNYVDGPVDVVQHQRKRAHGV